MDIVEKYQEHLDRVSRSFAVCVARLESPLRRYFGLTYLLCRVLDTIEDAPWLIRQRQSHGFKLFERAVQTKSHIDRDFIKIEDFGDIPDSEKLLIKDVGTLLHDLNDLPEEHKSIISQLLMSMSKGMQHFSKSENQKVQLQSLQEVNQYCFFVAGIVGETLARIVSAVDLNMKLSLNLLKDAHHFGLFLQKVNLLKDQTKDEREGRFLIPSKNEVFQSMRKDALGAKRYIDLIPDSRNDYRVFCLWSLFLALKTLPQLKHQSENNKLSRVETLKLFTEIEENSMNHAWIENNFLGLMEKIEFDSTWVQPHFPPTKFDWFKDCYSGILPSNELATLGLT